MSILLKKILWYSVDTPSVAINLTDSIDMNIGRGLDIQNNIVNINLKNSAQSFNSAGEQVHKYVDETGTILFQEQDQIKIYLKYTDDMADVESVAWNNDKTKHNGNVTSEPTSDDLKGVYYVIEFNVKTDIKNNPIKLKCADKTYILFNRLLAQAMIETTGYTTPQAIQKVVRFSSQANNKTDSNFYGTGDDPGVVYDVDAKLVSEGGFIQDTRKSTTEDGSVNSVTTFPTAVLSKIWKPVYEWVGELSQIEYLNFKDELDNTKPIVYGRPFLNYVDEQNKFHWFETDNVVGEVVTIGTTKGIIDYNLDKKVFDTVNFIVFRGGEDFYGKGTLDYHFEESSNVKEKKMRVIAMTDVAAKLIQAEIANGNLVANTAGVFTFSGNRYDRNGNVTPAWNDTEYTTDNSYNDSLRIEISRIGKSRARKIAQGLANARYKGKLDRKGTIVTVGALLQVTNTKTGQVNELIRVMDVRDTVTKSGWFTNIQIEQDQDAIIAGDVT